MTVGAAIAEIRRKLRLTQAEMAKRLGVERSTVSQYEINRSVPSPLVLIKLDQIAGQHGCSGEKAVVEGLLREHFQTGLLGGAPSMEDTIARLLPGLDRALLSNSIMDLLPSLKRKDFGFRQFVPAVAGVFEDAETVDLSVSQILNMWSAHWDNPAAEDAFRDALGFLQVRLWSGEGAHGGNPSTKHPVPRVTSKKKR